MTTHKTHPAAKSDAADSVKNDINRHCVETAIAAVHRVCDFRTKEVEQLIERYVELLPAEVRETPIAQL